MTHNCNWHYLYSGLQVTSEIEIPEWAIYQSAESFIEPDVRICLDDTITPTGLEDHHPVITLDEVRFTIEETGTYRGQCAELCGKDHGFMPIVIEAVSQDDYRTWSADTKQAQIDFVLTG